MQRLDQLLAVEARNRVQSPLKLTHCGTAALCLALLALWSGSEHNEVKQKYGGSDGQEDAPVSNQDPLPDEEDSPVTASASAGEEAA